MSKYFGTDGFRGEANVSLTSLHAYQIGRFLGFYYSYLKNKEGSNEKAKIVIGKDTRLSSYMFEYSLVAGATSTGADVYMLHVTTTPSVAYVTRVDEFDCGIMISASHNPYTDNGIKLIDKSGIKMPENVISLLEDYLDGNLILDGVSFKELPFATGNKIGKTIDYASGRNRYIGYLISLGLYSFKDKRVGLDCANGASWMIAKVVFEAFGAKLYVINDDPNGENINLNAGSTHIEGLVNLVKEKNLDVGFAFDGDADRCLAVDEFGNVVNGDQIMYLCAKHMKDKGKLEPNVVVATIMSNFGLFKALDKAGIEYVKTKVGDRFVQEYMGEHGCLIGGEQSGHTIFSKYATTGDGILTALKVMEVMLSTKLPLSKLASPCKMYPQTIINIKVSDKESILNDKDVLSSVDEVSKKLGDSGRVLLRASGTEPLVRVMVEATIQKEAEEYAQEIANVIRNKL